MWTIAPITSMSDPTVMPQIEAIFFDSAATRRFASEAERAAFRDLWLGRYIRHCPDEFLVATTTHGVAVGYLAGALISNREPLPGPDYYGCFPPELIDEYPAHLHVNVRHDHRGRNAGSALVDAFRKICIARTLSGVHVVTAGHAATFFTHCGLAERATADWRGRNIAFLAG